MSSSLTAEQLEKLQRANIANIAKKLQSGKTLTGQEQRVLMETRRPDADTLRDYMREGAAIMQRIRDIIEASKLSKRDKERIFAEIASIDP